MKKLLMVMMMISLLGSLFVLNVYAVNQIKVTIKFEQAKDIYNTMTGTSVQKGGAAGHLYRTGKSIVCQYTDVDMNDSQGHSIPKQDPSRYVCTMQVDSNGFAISAA